MFCRNFKLKEGVRVPDRWAAFVVYCGGSRQVGCLSCPLFLNKASGGRVPHIPSCSLRSVTVLATEAVSGCVGAPGSTLLGITSDNLGPGSAQEEKVCLCSR